MGQIFMMVMMHVKYRHKYNWDISIFRELQNLSTKVLHLHVHVQVNAQHVCSGQALATVFGKKEDKESYSRITVPAPSSRNEDHLGVDLLSFTHSLYKVRALNFHLVPFNHYQRCHLTFVQLAGISYTTK